RREGLISAWPFRDLEQAGGLDDRHREGVGGVGLQAEPDARDWIGIGGARCRDGELRPDDIGKEAEPALVGLEMTHEPHQRIALLEETKTLALMLTVLPRTVALPLRLTAQP